MDFALFLASAYLAVCAALPALVGWRRGLARRHVVSIVLIGALLGWTGYGAFLAWALALFETPESDRVALIISLH